MKRRETVLALIAGQAESIGHLEPGTVTVRPEMLLSGPDLDLDEVDVMSIVLDLEAEFGLTIADEDHYEWRTVQDILNYVEENQD